MAENIDDYARVVNHATPLASFRRLATARFWYNKLIYFCVFSLLGHLLIEWPYCWVGATFFNTLDPTAEVLTNPFKPFFVYGVAMLVIGVFLDPLKDALRERFAKRRHALAVFYVISVFLAMAGELIQGFLQNQPVDGVYPLWDVHDLPGNILGQAWIVNDVLFAVAITFATWVLYPVCERLLGKLTGRRARVNAIIVVGLFIALCLITYGVI